METSTNVESTSLSPAELQKLDAYWRASNYLAVGQIYLFDSPLLKDPLSREHIKRRLLGYWGTTPGLNLIYVHLNRIIKKHDLNMIYIAGPGHGGPAMVAQTYLEGTYSEFYPNISRDTEGMKRLFKQFSFPGGIPSHVAPETPGSIHEGGELGYKEEGTLTTPFDMCVLNDLDRFHLAIDVLDRVERLVNVTAHLRQNFKNKLLEHKEYIRCWGEDMPEIRDWTWPRDPS